MNGTSDATGRWSRVVAVVAHMQTERDTAATTANNNVRVRWILMMMVRRGKEMMMTLFVSNEMNGTRGTRMIQRAGVSEAALKRFEGRGEVATQGGRVGGCNRARCAVIATATNGA